MKKKILGSFAIVAIAASIAFSVNVSSTGNGLSDISLENVEALANMSEGKGTLYGTADGNHFCCCSGSRSCGASKCKSC